VRTLNRLKLDRGVSKVLFCDNDSEFISQAMDLWKSRSHIGLQRLRLRRLKFVREQTSVRLTAHAQTGSLRRKLDVDGATGWNPRADGAGKREIQIGRALGYHLD
jgi:hypothetical protein